jgi:hypothetical protein
MNYLPQLVRTVVGANNFLQCFSGSILQLGHTYFITLVTNKCKK